MTDRDETSGPQRAAAFLLSLDKEAAANVLKHLDESVIVEVVEAMGQMDSKLTAPDSIRGLEKEFVRSLGKPRGARLRSEAELRAMLEQTLGKTQAAALYDKINQRLLHERPFIAIEKEAPESIAKALGEESEAVAALVLAHLDPELSGAVLKAFEPERSLEVVRRMARVAPPGFQTLVAIAQTLTERLRAIAQGSVAPDQGQRLRTVAEILNFSNPATERNVLEGLSQSDAEMAAAIREFMFTWEDLATVDKRSMQKILAAVDTKTLAVALKASSAPVEQNILGNLSQRVREMIADERELAGAVPMAEVQNSRNEIMKAVRALMESGEFRPARAGDELVS